MAFLQSRQEPDGTWYGRWGCNYIYGTWLALRGLLARGRGPLGAGATSARRSGSARGRTRTAAGASCRTPTTIRRLKAVGPSTPSQTAWALMALFATGDDRSECVRRGVDYLLATQQYDGSWRDEHWTGTGFPKVFYLRYHLYATYFPLWALSVYAREAVSPALPARAGASARIPARPSRE